MSDSEDESGPSEVRESNARLHILFNALLPNSASNARVRCAFVTAFAPLQEEEEEEEDELDEEEYEKVKRPRSQFIHEEAGMYNICGAVCVSECGHVILNVTSCCRGN